ncbi:MAG: DUF177 domain-containing protein [Pseudomonadota bacterium]
MPTLLRIADLATRKPTPFGLEPNVDSRLDLARALGIVEIRKLRLSGKIAPLGKTDWQLEAVLGATVVQDCVVTLEPVVTRIDEPVQRTYSAAFEAADAGEVEMPADDTIDPIPEVLDLNALMAEALSLALPAFPRSGKVELGEAIFSATGVEPLTDEAAKPFAGLQGLRDELSKKSD